MTRAGAPLPGSTRYVLLGADCRPYLSTMPGQLGGHRRGKLYGRLDCPAALRAIAAGGYVRHRVFFADEATAVTAGYRPCAACLPDAYRKWKSRSLSRTRGTGRPHIPEPASVFPTMLDDLPGTYGRRSVMSGSFGASRVHTKVESPLGELTLVREGERIAGLYFEHHWYRPSQSSFGPRVDDGFDTIMCQLQEYFAGRRQTFDLPTLLAGTCEQVAVWRLLGRIPYGQTTTYGALARELGLDIPARDVGKLIGRNPLCIIVPCHRVVGASGDLTGYAGGLARKRALLELEGAPPVPSQQLMLSFDNVADPPGGQRLRLTGRSVVAIG